MLLEWFLQSSIPGDGGGDDDDDGDGGKSEHFLGSVAIIRPLN